MGVRAQLLVAALAVTCGIGLPVDNSPPQLTGTPTKGETLELAAGGWSGKYLTFTYQWQRCDAQGADCAPIPGETVVTQLRTVEYTLGQADVGARLRVAVTAANPAGSATAFSNPTPVVADTGYAAGTIGRYEVFSPALGRAQEVLVYLPPGYRRAGRRRYPVLYLLHGYPGDPTSFVDGVPAGAVEDALLAAHAMRPTILVMPSGNSDPPADNAWANGIEPDSGWETFVARDVVRWTDACFDTDAQPSARGIAGLSDGGYGALDLALHHPGEFRLVESWSGFMHADRTLESVYGDGTELAAYDSPALYLPHAAAALRRAGVYFWLYVGDQDAGLAENEQFASELAAERVPHTLSVFPGSHLPSFWRAHLPLALQIASGRLAASQAGPRRSTTRCALPADRSIRSGSTTSTPTVTPTFSLISDPRRSS